MAPSKLSIIFVTNNYTPYQGGVVSSILLTVDALRAQGHTVKLITLDFENKQTAEEDIIRLYCPLRFMYKSNHMALPWCPAYYIDKLIQQFKPDIIHVHHPFLLGASALKVARSRNVPVIFTYHTLYEQYLHYIPLPKQLICPVVKTLVQSFCTTVQGIIAPSTTIKDYIQTIAPMTLTQVIPSGVPVSFFSNNKHLKKLQKPFKLLIVSRFTQEKNITFLLDVIALLKPSHYLFTLAGYGVELSFLQNYAFSHKNLSPKNVIFIERPSKLTLIDLYAQADLFIFASHTETQGIVLAEAMAQGTPVITLDGPGQRDIVIDEFNGYLVSSASEMKEKIELCTKNPSLHCILQENARKTAQNYTPDHLIERLINFYQALID